jgi:hypothetical protein
MATHATEKMRNVRATLYTWLSGLTITGTPTLVVEDQERAGGSSPDSFIRATIEDLPGRYTGRFSSSLVAVERRLLLVLDVFQRSADDQASSNLYDIESTADDLVSELTLVNVDLADYATDNTGATLTDAVLRVLDVPARRVLPTTDGYARRQVQATFTWHSRKAA